ncbi:hypothetical protein EVAR_94074_1 [Eumeta japonica]|uniref:Uncharacterized protein n=1 Tax=Eumeta variegata TaxID=151549 RepID=A0A4C1V5J6_EUMVA|nr:hypothetical protein EVAR_94074_1 [Eumeta japonica]
MSTFALTTRFVNTGPDSSLLVISGDFRRLARVYVANEPYIISERLISSSEEAGWDIAGAVFSRATLSAASAREQSKGFVSFPVPSGMNGERLFFFVAAPVHKKGQSHMRGAGVITPILVLGMLNACPPGRSNYSARTCRAPIPTPVPRSRPTYNPATYSHLSLQCVTF